MRKFPRIVAAAALAGLAGLASLPARGDDSAATKATAAAPEASRAGVVRTLGEAGRNAESLAGAILRAPDDEQRAAVAFLVAHLPPVDRETLAGDYLLSNVAYAFKARAATPWAAAVPIELFYNDVLPYSSVNERRDDWRKDFYDRFIEVAKSAPDASEAARRLNTAAFEAFHVKYHASKRPKPDQSPYESAEAGYASCTGLSILLIDACRAVGIPARLVGTPRWTTQPGNHNWVEVWDREWKFVGACEPSKLNEGWFIAQAAAADEKKPEHRIYASSFAAAPEHFPLVWKRDVRDYPAEDVTRRYTMRRKVTFRLPDGTPPAAITVRHDGRIVAHDRLRPAATFELPGDSTYEVELRRDGQPAATRSIKLNGDAEQVVTLESPR